MINNYEKKSVIGIRNTWITQKGECSLFSERILIVETKLLFYFINIMQNSKKDFQNFDYDSFIKNITNSY